MAAAVAASMTNPGGRSSEWICTGRLTVPDTTERALPASWQFVRKPRRARGRQSLREPARRTPERYGIHPLRLSSFN